MLTLVKLSPEYERQLTEMMNEWTDSGEKIIPYSIRKYDYHNFDFYLDHLDVDDDIADELGLVPDTTFFALDTDRDIFVGAVNIRKYLNERLMSYGGHIGDGIRPSERGKGYGTEMISLALDECRKMGINRVLMVCDQSNKASARVIVKNGGILENEISVEGEEPVQRYWIDLGVRTV